MNAHGDVVPPGLGWTKDPYGGEIADSEHGPVMYGRGVAVSSPISPPTPMRCWR